VRGLRLGRTSLDKDNITILDNIVLALGHDLTLRLDASFIAFFPQHAVVVYDDLNECLLKVAVNDTGSLRCLGAVPYGPLPDLIGTSCKETAKVESLAHGNDDLGQDGLGTNSFLLLSRLRVRHGSEALLVRDGNGNDGVASGVLLDPLSNLGQVLVLLANVVLLAEVYEEDDGLGRK
jgi:hypothetical protein